MDSPYRSKDPDLADLRLNVSNHPSGNHRHVDVTKDICEETLHLCRRAGLAGLISLKMQLVLSRITAKPGLRVGSPTPYGVEIIWNAGNRQHIKMILNCSQRIGADELHSRLRAALKGKDVQSQPAEEKKMPQPLGSADSVLARILGESGEMTESLRTGSESAQDSVPELPNSQEEEKSTYSAFMNDPDRIELFLLEIVRVANPRGEFAAKQAVEVLQEHFGFSTEWKGAYNCVYRLATQRSVLEKIEHGYRIPRDKFLELKTPKAQSEMAGPSETSALEESAVEAEPTTQPEVTEPVEEVATAETVVSESGAAPQAEMASAAQQISMPTEALDFLKGLDALEKYLEHIRAKRARAAEISEERQQIVAQIEELHGRDEALANELASFSAELDDPQIAEAEAMYEALVARFAARSKQEAADE